METLNALGRLKEIPLDMTLEGLRSVGQAQQTDQIGLQELMRKQQYEQAMDPMRLQQQSLENDRGLQALAKAKRENVEADYTSKARMDAELHKHLAETSGSDLKMVQDRFQQMAYSPDPKVRQIGITGLQSTKDWMMKKEENDRHLEGIREQGKTARYVADRAADTRVQVAGMKGAGGGGFNPKTPEHLYAYYMNLAFNETDPAKQEQARALANEQLTVMREKWATKGVPEGTIDPSKAGGKERPTVPTVPKADVSRPPTKEQAAKETPKGPTQADLEFTAKKHGLTVEQVKAKLGIK